MRRKEALITDEVYHVFSRSIADFRIFNKESEYLRTKNLMRYYQLENMKLKFSHFLELKRVDAHNFNDYFASFDWRGKELVQIIAYCIMPTHLHLVLKQLIDGGISTFMRKILNSYACYFNARYNRKGPLWESRFKNVLIKSDEQLLHVTRYVHLNPVTAYLVDKPEDWLASSYREYIGMTKDGDNLCKYSSILDIEPNSYREFVEDRISYQRELALIKTLCID